MAALAEPQRFARPADASSAESGPVRTPGSPVPAEELPYLFVVRSGQVLTFKSLRELAWVRPDLLGVAFDRRWMGERRSRQEPVHAERRRAERRAPAGEAAWGRRGFVLTCAAPTQVPRVRPVVEPPPRAESVAPAKTGRPPERTPVPVARVESSAPVETGRPPERTPVPVARVRVIGAGGDGPPARADAGARRPASSHRRRWGRSTRPSGRRCPSPASSHRRRWGRSTRPSGRRCPWPALRHRRRLRRAARPSGRRCPRPALNHRRRGGQSARPSGRQRPRPALRHRRRLRRCARPSGRRCPRPALNHRRRGGQSTRPSGRQRPRPALSHRRRGGRAARPSGRQRPRPALSHRRR